METGHIVNDKYQIVSKIGRGAYSNWYKALWLPDESSKETQEVVIKVASKAEFSFLDEYLVSQEVPIHNRLLRYKDYGSVSLPHSITGEIDSYDFLVSDVMPNGDLFTFVTNNGFNESWARFLFKNVLKGIESLHKDGYAHLDVKLGNILLDKNYFPKLADFGFLQRIPDDKMLSSQEFTCKGTKHYVCPEIYTEEYFDAQSADIFALGVSFFILLVGEYPFGSAKSTDTKYQNLFKKDPFIFWKKHSRAKKKI